MFKQKRRAEKVAFYIENETFGFQCANGQTDIVIHGGAVWVNFKVKNVASDFDDHIAEHASSYSLFTQQQKNVLRGAYIDLSDSCAPRRSSNLLNYKSPLNSIRRHLKLKNQSKTWPKQKKTKQKDESTNHWPQFKKHRVINFTIKTMTKDKVPTQWIARFGLGIILCGAIDDVSQISVEAPTKDVQRLLCRTVAHTGRTFLSKLPHVVDGFFFSSSCGIFGWSRHWHGDNDRMNNPLLNAMRCSSSCVVLVQQQSQTGWIAKFIQQSFHGMEKKKKKKTK